MTVFDPLLDVCRAGQRALARCRRGFELDAIDLGPELGTKISVRLSFSQLLSLSQPRSLPAVTPPPPDSATTPQAPR